jgi:hypothetical protein
LAKGVGPAVVICALLVAVTGCGGESGVSAGASVAAYVEAPLCPGATRALARQGGKAGEVRVRAVCLASAEGGGKVDLATIGANARRATEDSAGVAYIEAPARPSFSRPIVESAGIAVLRTTSGAAAMDRLLKAIAESGTSGSLRESVREALG